MLLLRRLLLILALCAGAGTGFGAGFDPPGLAADSAAYLRAITARNPAGLPPQARLQAEQRAADAQKRNDWATVAASLETRLSGGAATADLWLQLARAQLRRATPDPARAAQAAWQAFAGADAGSPEIPSLLVMAEAFRAMDRPESAIAALEAVVERAPQDTAVKQQLAEARRAAGILVRRVRTEPESDPPLACIDFTSAPARRADLVPGDWVRLQPAVAAATVTRDRNSFCIAGLPLGASTQVTVRQGLPGEDGVGLRRDATLNVVMPNRQARLIFNDKLFLLPRNQAPRVSLSSVNLSAVKLKLLRLGERNLVPWARDVTLGQALERYNFENQTDNGKVVWEGIAAIPHWQPNQVAHTALPLPDVFDAPGAYMLLATPGDGSPSEGVGAVQVVIRTDLAPTVWRGADGLTVQVRSFADAAPRADVRLSLLSRSNDVLAEATTDADGVARFALPLLQGTGPQAPQSLHGQAGNDLVALDLTTAAFDLSDRGVAGLADPGPLDAFAWTDRGIYRPGETVQVMALLRDAAGQPAGMPVHLVVKRPNGQVFLDRVPSASGDASVYLPVALSQAAAAGQWSVEVLADPTRPPIGRAAFRVDAFVPDRMAVEATPSGPIVPGEAYALPVTARFLYGAPAADLSGSASLRLVRDPTPPAALAGYRVGLDGEPFAPEAKDLVLPNTDKDGHATLPILLASAPDSTGPVRAELDIAVDDPSGRASHTQVTIPVRPVSGFIGIKPGFGESVDAGAEASFDIAAVDREGARAGMPVKMRLVRERPDWRIVTRGSVARYETVYRDELIDQTEVVVPQGEALHYGRRVEFGRYRLEVVERDGLAASSVRFRAGWVASDSADTPDKVDVSTDRQAYAPGEVAHVRIVSPFAGRATLLTLTNRVHGLRTLEVKEGGTTVDVPVDAAWGPGAYVAVHVFRGGESGRPGRAIGLAWAGIEPAARTLAVSLAVPEKVAPRQRITVPVRTEPGAWVTLAAVDEGILRLTRFASPDPAAHYLGRRMLGLDIRDDWGRLIPPAEGEATALRQGGDDGGGALPEIPQNTVALFVPPVQAGVDGVAQVSLDLPDFNGQVRLMAVGWQGNRIGSAVAGLIVRDALVAEPLLPRFLAPGDEARLAVQMQNLDLPAGEAVTQLSVEGPLAIAGETRLAATLERGAQVVRTTMLRATGVGRGVIRLAVTGPGGFHVERETAILVRPARPAVTLVSTRELGPGVEAQVVPALDRMQAGTGRASLGVGGAVRYDVAALVRSLQDYPLLCLEQASSKGLPLALLPGGAEQAGQLQLAVNSILDKQRFDGGFGLWSANNEAEPWLSAYATETLLRARTAGAAVPDGAMKDALKFLADASENSAETPEALAARAYDLYALALGGQPRAGANRLLAEQVETLPTPLSKAQLGAALALSNDRPRAEAAFAAALAAPGRRDWDADRGSALRDQAATLVLLKESGLLADRVTSLIGRLPGADLQPDQLNTQEAAWAASAGAVLGRDGRPASVSVNGETLPPAPLVQVALSGPATVRNLGDRAVWQSVSTTGVPAEPWPAARQGMRVSRRFFTSAGEPLDLEQLKQNTVFVLLVEGRADDGFEHRALLMQGLPAGWEIAGKLEAGKTAGMAWLGDLSEVEAQPAADDRFTSTMMLTKAAPAFRVAVRLRAVTPGSFELPGAMLSDMYRPSVFARQATGRIKVLAAE